MCLNLKPIKRKTQKMKLKVWTTVLLCLMLFCGCPLSIAESVNLIPIESIDTFSSFVSDILHPGYVYVLNTDTPFTPISIDADTFLLLSKRYNSMNQKKNFIAIIHLLDYLLRIVKCFPLPNVHKSIYILQQVLSFKK